MNIYDIVSGCEEEHASEEEELAGVKVRKLFASVTFQPKDEMWLVMELQGKPFSKPWRMLELRFDKPKLPHADFPEFDYPSLVCNERAMAVVGDVLQETGELFPVKVRGDKGTYQLHNIPSMKAKLLDAKKTTWRMIGDQKCLHVPAFHGDRIGAKLKLFKIPEDYGLRNLLRRAHRQSQRWRIQSARRQAWLDRTALQAGLDRREGAGRQEVQGAAAKKKPDKPKMSDRPLNAKEQRDIDLSIKRGYKYLKLDPKSSPKKTQEAMLQAIDAIVAREEETEKRRGVGPGR